MNIHQNKDFRRGSLWFSLGEATVSLMKSCAAIGEKLWPPALLVFVLALLAYSILPPEYEVNARSNREICERLVKSGYRTQEWCDKHYNDSMELGRAAYRAKIASSPAPLAKR